MGLAQPPPGEKWISSVQVARELRMGKMTVTREIHRGKLKAYQVGGKGMYWVKPEDLATYVTTYRSMVPVQAENDAERTP